LNELRGVYEGMRRALLVSLIALVCAPAAAAKEGKAVVVIGPNGRALVEPFAPFTSVLGQFDIKGAVPTGPYVLVYPLMERGIPMRPGRWYPSAGVLCSGWRTGVEAGCTKAPHLRGWLGRGVATGVFRGEPTRLTSLVRQRIQLPAYSNEATAIEMSLNQVGRTTATPRDCVSFAGRWTGPRASMRPKSFCISSAGGIYAAGKQYPLPRSAALFVIG
jgi:hypothetical protein